MIEGTIIKDGILKLILTGSDEIDNACLKQLNGATCKIISDNLRVGDKLIANGLMIELELVDAKQVTKNPPLNAKP